MSGLQNYFGDAEQSTTEQAKTEVKKITLQELESHLWKAADILRGSIDSSEYKHYIFGLLFLKRLSDVFVEEATKIEQKLSNGKKFTPEQAKEIAWEDKDEHQFFVPKRARWHHIQTITEDIGAALSKAMEALEDENPSLEGVLRNIDYNNKDRLPDRVLSELIIHFSKIPLSNSNLSDPDILGRAYEYLIAQFADDAGKKGGEFYTPKEVVRLIVELIKPQEGMRICDPTVGSGGMLIQCANYVEEHGGDRRRLSLFGQEKNLNTWTICKMNMLLHDHIDAVIEKGDTIRDPKLIKGDELMLFDRVIANPPFSLKGWGKNEAQNEKFGRFKYGIPPKSYGDTAFLQHMIATINEEGIVGIVMPHGVLFRGNTEKSIRKGILEEDLIEAVIGLPENLFYGTGIPGCIIIINRNKPKERKKRVLFIHAAENYESGSAQNYLRDEDIEKIVGVYDRYEEIERYSRVVESDEIEENDFVLNISRYVDTFEPEEEIDLKQVYEEWEEAIEERDKATDEVRKSMEGLNI